MSTFKTIVDIQTIVDIHKKLREDYRKAYESYCEMPQTEREGERGKRLAEKMYAVKLDILVVEKEMNALVNAVPTYRTPFGNYTGNIKE